MTSDPGVESPSPNSAAVVANTMMTNTVMTNTAMTNSSVHPVDKQRSAVGHRPAPWTTHPPDHHGATPDEMCPPEGRAVIRRGHMGWLWLITVIKAGHADRHAFHFEVEVAASPLEGDSNLIARSVLDHELLVFLM